MGEVDKNIQNDEENTEELMSVSIRNAIKIAENRELIRLAERMSTVVNRGVTERYVEIQKSLEANVKMIKKAFEIPQMQELIKFQSHLSDVIRVMNENIKISMDGIQQSIKHSPIMQRKRLGKKNWVIPMQITNLTQLEESLALDEEIQRMYFAEDGRVFEEMIAIIRNSKYMECKKEIFDEALKVYNLEYYFASGHMLAPLVEWLLEDDNNKANIRIYQLHERFARKFDEVSIKEPYVHILLALNGFIENYKKTVRFTEEEPEFLNRHWIMHGRMQKPFTKYHSLQLISVLYAIVELLEVEIGE